MAFSTDFVPRLFWPLFVILAVWLQLLFPGMDFFAAGIILCLQREGVGKAAPLILVCILIQEGAGPLAFGTSVLRYGALIGFYLLGRNLFEVHSPAFILLLGLVFSVVHFFSLKTMAGLQVWSISDPRVLFESALLFIIFLVEWLLLSKAYRMFFPHATRS